MRPEIRAFCADLVVMTTTAVLIMVGVASPPAFGQSTPSQDSGAITSAREVSGTYRIDELGLQIDLPEGWKGVQAEVQPSEDFPIEYFLMAFPPDPSTPLPENLTYEDYKDFVGIYVIFTGNISDILTWDIGETYQENMCGMPISSRIITIGEDDAIKAIELIDSCEYPPGIMITKAYVVGVEDKVIWITISGYSQTAYDRYLGEFERSVSTLQITKPVDISQYAAFSTTGEYEARKLEATVEGTSYELEVLSNSAVSNFALDEEDKQLTLQIEGEEGTKGSTSVEIGTVLEGPYVVSIDGEIIDRGFMVIRDETTNRTSINVTYDHSVHEIVITGTNVVPEFPLPVIAVVAGILGVTVALTRASIIQRFGTF